MDATRRSGQDQERRDLTIGFVATLLGLAAFGVMADLIRPAELSALDTHLVPFVRALASPPVTSAMESVSLLGSVGVLGAIVFVSSVGLIVGGRPRSDAAFLVTTAIG